MSRPSAKPSSARFRRRKLAGRSLRVLAVVAVAGLLVLCDRLGVFGRAPLPDEAKYHDQTFRVVKVIDGDTFDVDIPDGKYDTTRIRLWGVDTPEVHDPDNPDAPPEHFGPEASRFAKELLEGADVRLELVPSRIRGIHGRLLAYVYLDDGRMLNRLLIEQGYGYADPRFDHPRKEEFRELQREAMRAGRGLWAEVTEAKLPDYYQGRLDVPTAD
ncbi:MAG: thermonuclease family protein [Phycisphaerae bacterium]